MSTSNTQTKQININQMLLVCVDADSSFSLESSKYILTTSNKGFSFKEKLEGSDNEILSVNSDAVFIVGVEDSEGVYSDIELKKNKTYSFGIRLDQDKTNSIVFTDFEEIKRVVTKVPKVSRTGQGCAGIVRRKLVD